MSNVFFGFLTPHPGLIRFCPIAAHAPTLWCPILTLYRRFPKLAICFQFLAEKLCMYLQKFKILFPNFMGKRKFVHIVVKSFFVENPQQEYQNMGCPIFAKLPTPPCPILYDFGWPPPPTLAISKFLSKENAAILKPLLISNE